MNTGLKFALEVCSLHLFFSCTQKLPYQDTSLPAEQRAEDFAWILNLGYRFFLLILIVKSSHHRKLSLVVFSM